MGLAAALTLTANFSTVSAQADDLEKIKAGGEQKISTSGQYGGVVVEEGAPADMFRAPKHERTRTFLRKYLSA